MSQPYKTRLVTPDEIPALQEQPGFISTCRYGEGMQVERNEIGAIVTNERNHRLHKSGLWVSDCVVLERIFLK